MSLAPVTNFGKATVSATYDAAATLIVLTTGHGSRFPSTFSYPVTWWNATDYPDPADDPNREIVTVTNRTGDTLTVTRGAESTGASTKNTAGKTYKMVLTITKAMWEALSTQNLSQTFRGLRLSTHPSADLAVKQTMFSADVIVMNDGEAVHNWSNVVTDITLAGAGGLDTGSEQNATMYGQYALWNGTDQKGCLHRDRDWFLDLDITAGEDATQGIRSAVDNSTVRVSQGITPVTAGKLVFIDVELIKVGTPTGNIWFELQSNSGGVPSNTVLASSWKFDVSRIPTTAGGTTMRIPFLVPYSVSASTLYHIVAQGDWTVSATNYVGWRMDGSAAAYAGGSKALFDSDTSTWTADTDDDMWLRCYIERNNVDFATTVPAGYRYAHIGYVYNDSGGNFIPFTQEDRVWNHKRLTNGLVVNETSGGTQLVDMRTFLPACERTTARLGLTGTGGAVATGVIGDLDAPDVSNGVPFTGASASLGYYSTGEFLGWPVSASIPYCGCMLDASSGADLYILGFTW